MDFPELLYAFDLLGSFAFAISGALVGMRKRYDIVGIFVITFLTTVAGGTMRSVLLGDAPAVFLTDITFVFIALLATAMTYFLKNYLFRFTKLIKLFDAIGVGFFFTTGMTVALQNHLGFISSSVIGIISATSSGVLRELLSAEIPFIFRKELYTVVCIVGGFWYFVLYLFPIPREYIIASTIVVVILLRVSAIQRNWSLTR